MPSTPSYNNAGVYRIHSLRRLEVTIGIRLPRRDIWSEMSTDRHAFVFLTPPAAGIELYAYELSRHCIGYADISP